RRYDNNMEASGTAINRGGIVGREYIIYDATNGTISAGNIIRSQKMSDQEQVRNTNVLGPH
ncbi:MAG: hypothetical protein KF858_14820, partial [Candidatus Sumerlaeia bacterium]|nr:hypothetical protein [Candidatus Sumerlaeia bacterium]